MKKDGGGDPVRGGGGEGGSGVGVRVWGLVWDMGVWGCEPRNEGIFKSA